MHARPRYLAPHINARLAQGTASTHCRSVFSTHDMVQRYGTEVWYRGTNTVVYVYSWRPPLRQRALCRVSRDAGTHVPTHPPAAQQLLLN